MRILLISILLVLSYCVFGQSNNNTDNNSFQVLGDAILRVQPDQVVLSLGVDSRGKELVATKAANATIIKKAIAYCQEKGIPDKYIQTDYVRINPHFQYRNEAALDYYSVSQVFSIVISDLEQYESILTELLKLGVNKVNNIEFRTTKLKEYRYQVRKMAIEAAKEKATFLSEQVGIKLGPIVNISEMVNHPMNAFSRNNYANFSQNMVQNTSGIIDGGTLSVGLLSLKATITLTYIIP